MRRKQTQHSSIFRPCLSNNQCILSVNRCRFQTICQLVLNSCIYLFHLKVLISFAKGPSDILASSRVNTSPPDHAPTLLQPSRPPLSALFPVNFHQLLSTLSTCRPILTRTTVSYCLFYTFQKLLTSPQHLRGHSYRTEPQTAHPAPLRFSSPPLRYFRPLQQPVTPKS